MAAGHTVRVRGSAWYIFKHWSTSPGDGRGEARRGAVGTPFDGLARPPAVELARPFRTSKGIRNRFPGDSTLAYLVVTSAPAPPEVDAGWTAEPAELDEGFTTGPDGIRLIHVVGMHRGRWGDVQECIFAVTTSAPATPSEVPILGHLRV